LALGESIVENLEMSQATLAFARLKEMTFAKGGGGLQGEGKFLEEGAS